MIFSKKLAGRYAFLLLILVVSKASFAQSIKGKVVDGNTGEPLVGAVVRLDNTNLVTIVKLDGTYTFSKVNPGKYTLKISYQDNKKNTDTTITVTANQTTVVNMMVAPEAIELSSVTISATGLKDDKGARRLEKIADPIVNILSAKTIQLLPDITVANALQRVSGVTIEKSSSGEARYPIIRGMEKRYINTLINGIKIPSPDNKNRFVPLDLFPSELLERLEVSKTLTPSMEGDAIGGTINLVMKDAPTKRLFQVNAALGYNTTFSSGDYLKFNKTSMKKMSPAEINGGNYVATGKDFLLGHFDYSKRNTPINSTFGITVGNRFGKDSKLGFIFSGSYQNIFRGTTSNFFLPNPQPGLNNIPLFSDLQLRHYSVQSVRIGLNGKLDLRINKSNKISFASTFVSLNDYQTRIVYDTVALNSLVDNWQRSTWQYQSIYNSTLQGFHTLRPSLKMDWSIVYSNAFNHIPDQSQFIHEYGIVSSAGPDKLQSMSRTWTHNSDRDFSFYLNFTKNMKLLGKPLELKAGSLLRGKRRNNHYINYGLKPQSGELYTTIDNAVFIFNPPSEGAPAVTGNNYSFIEDVSAIYLQGKWQLTQKLEALGGLRIEGTHQKYETELGKDVNAKSGAITYTDYLPSIQFKYALRSNQNIRLAYYKALARPGFSELIPDGADGEFFKEVGDPVNLVHAYADNLDLRYEMYSKNADQLLLGVFYKNIQNPIEIAAVKPQGVNSLWLQPVNKGTATNYGFEAVFTKYFGSFGISANYTFTKSRISDSLIYSYRDSTGVIVSSKVSETRPLQGQSDNVANLSLIYKNPKIGLDLQTALVYTGERISFLSPYLGLHYWQSPTTQLDISFEKRIIKKLSFYGKINNLTNAPFVLSLHQSYNNYLTASGSRSLALQTDPDNKIIIQKDYYKTTYLFGFRYKF